MTKRFKDLQVGDKIYIDMYSTFVHNIKFENGYMAIQVSRNIDDRPNPWLGWMHIPMNHLSANKVKMGSGTWVFLTKKAYKKHMYEIINREIKR